MGLQGRVCRDLEEDENEDEDGDEKLCCMYLFGGG